MNLTDIKGILRKYKKGEIQENEIINNLSRLSVENLGFARIDHHRSIRKGFPEVIFCEGKSPGQILKIASSIVERSGIFMATRASQEVFDYLDNTMPGLSYFEDARIITTKKAVSGKNTQHDLVLVVSAGTSDIPVAEEAAVTLKILGNNVKSINDIGIAGIHRVLENVGELQKARVIIVVAGMEGALPGVIGGLVNKPVIAVPTSVGYGASYGGTAALLAMLNCCSSGVTVVNIDNGFGAGCAASLIVNSK